MTEQPGTTTAVYLKDYQPPLFLIPRISLDFDLVAEDDVTVTAELFLRRNQEYSLPTGDLQLDVDELAIETVILDGICLSTHQYTIDSQHLSIANVPDSCTIKTVSRINPKSNTKLMGLYISDNGFFTQCEAEGFRRITPFSDRPDVMSRYDVTIHADKEACPVLLSNGNLVASGDEEGGCRHWARWQDPFPKPSYLFALVAGRLDHLSSSFTTCSGRHVQLQFFLEPHELDQGAFALDALKVAMRWDEQRYGREVDLNQFNLVAVADFNAGAMENKGLNVFNTKLVLTRQDLSTDSDFKSVDRTVAHEYFHNWTGDRVTLRDWFELSLKEGLTDFREQQYAEDRYSAGVERIQTVRNLRSFQFPEDAGPMAHAVRPQSYEKISNFYTTTIYNKGAEVVGMICTLLGPERYRKGMDLYFQRFDGCAVTTDDFVQAMQDASGIELTQFKRWYDQAGTPHLDVESKYDADSKTFELSITQSCKPTPGQPDKLPFHIPLSVGLITPEGLELPLQLQGEDVARETSRVLSLRKPTEIIRFLNVPELPVPSLGRHFSAPVIIDYDYQVSDLLLLLKFDSDDFNRWDAGQRLVMKLLLQAIDDHSRGASAPVFPDELFDAYVHILARASSDPAFAAEALTLPSEVDIGQRLVMIDPDRIHFVRQALRHAIANRLEQELRATYDQFVITDSYRPDAAQAGRRSIRNLSLSYLMVLDTQNIRTMCFHQFQQADNMTDVLSALTDLANVDCTEREQALKTYYEKWKDEPLVVDKWLGVQAASYLPMTVDVVRSLTSHPGYDLRNPSKVYALIGSFAGNQCNFHAANGAGYALVEEQIVALDPINPQVAANITRRFQDWKRFDPARQQKMKSVLQNLLRISTLSNETREVASKSLA